MKNHGVSDGDACNEIYDIRNDDGDNGNGNDERRRNYIEFSTFVHFLI